MIDAVTYFMEMIEFLGSNDTSQERAPFQVFTLSDTHGEDVQLATRKQDQDFILLDSMRTYQILSTTSCEMRFPLSSHLTASG